jgi:hypothetical protein
MSVKYGILLMAGNKLQVSENKVFRKISQSKKEKVCRQFRILDSEEFVGYTDHLVSLGQ